MIARLQFKNKILSLGVSAFCLALAFTGSAKPNLISNNLKKNNSAHATCTMVSAVTKTWVGGFGDWNEATNWSPAGIPLASDVVEIAGGGSLVTIPLGVTALAKAVILDGSDFTISTGGELVINGSVDNGLLIKEGTIVANNGLLQINNVALDAIVTTGTLGSEISNRGTISIGGLGPIGGKGLSLTNTTFINNDVGLVTLDGIANDFAVYAVTMGNFNNYGSIAFGNAGSVKKGIFSDIQVTNLGILEFNNVMNEAISVGTNFINNFKIVVSVGGKFNNKGTLRNNGEIMAKSLILNDGTFTNEGFITIDPTGTLTSNTNLTNKGSIRNNGLVNIAVGKMLTIENGATFYNESTGILDNKGTLSLVSGGVLDARGTTTGAGQIIRSGSFTSLTNSKIAPGNGIGTISVTGNFNLMEAMLDIEANGTAAPLHDYLTTNRNLIITTSSKLKFTIGGGYVPVTGDFVTVANGSLAVFGTFAPANLTVPPGWTVKYNLPATGNVTLYYVKPLAVELVTFKAVNKGSYNLLTWETATETNNKGFEIERKGVDGEWTNIGFVKGIGSGATYNFTDEGPLSISYYRLRQVDHDGKYEHSNVVSVSMTRKINAQVFPNPTRGRLTVQLPDDVTASIRVYNAVGQIVMTGSKVSGISEIDLSNLSRGTYIVEIQSEGVVLREKVVKL
jgi:hypothetical protein